MMLVLASASPARRAILADAGLAFDVCPADIDERAVEAPLLGAGASPCDIAMALGEAKAVAVSRTRETDLVIGADQVLELDGRALGKPATIAAAREQLLALAGRTHRLHSAAACARGGAILWRGVETAALTMRTLPADGVDAYLERVGDAALGSVGAYRIEDLGVQLFDKIEGDHFVILGLPLLALLTFLRADGHAAGLIP